MLTIPIGPFRPDNADTDSNISSNVLNVLVTADTSGTVSYAPLPSLTALGTDVLAANIKGWFVGVKAGGSYVVVVATSTAIYTVGATGAYTSIGSGYNLPAGDIWSFCQFGKYLILTNTNDGMLQYDLELGGAIAAISGAPKARGVRVIFDTLFAFDCDGENKLLRNSGFNYTDWTPGVGVAGYQPMPDGRELVGIEEVDDGTAIVIQRNSVRVLNRTADQSLYQMRLLPGGGGQGAMNPACIVKAAGAVYFWDSNGCKRASAGGIEPIGLGKASQWFLSLIGPGNFTSIVGGYDPTYEIVRWVILGDANGYGIDYHIRYNEFVPFSDTTVQAVFTTASPGYTMEDLDAFGTMDTITTSLDDRFWYGGIPQLGAIASGIYKIFSSGTNYTGTVETNTFNGPASQRIRSVTPNTDHSGVTVSVGCSDNLSVDLTYTTPATVQPSGRVPLSARGKNFSLKASLPSGTAWTYFRGFDALDMTAGGPR